MKLLNHYWLGKYTLNLTVNDTILFSFQKIPIITMLLATLATRWFHSSRLFPTKTVLNSTLSRIVLNTLQALLVSYGQYWTMLDISFLGVRLLTRYLPITWFGCHHLTWRQPKSRKFLLHPWDSYKNESHAIFSTCDKVLSLIYLFLNIDKWPIHYLI